jgi:bifunctional non-homologous end joining protein LigD
MATSREILDVAGHEVTVTNPGKVYFPELGKTKIDLVRYYLSVADGALAGAAGRPMALKRYVNGIHGEAFYQKRAPEKRPGWIETAELRFPSGRTAHEVVLRDAAGLAWIVNLGCVDLHTHPVRAEDLDHPDELRVDLDPIPGVPWSQVRDVGLVVREVLDDVGLIGWPKTSGSRGLHIYCRIAPRWTFTEVRRAAVALAREVERRAPGLATSKWWKEERHGVFVDYNQNAKDRTTASAYSVRPVTDARVSTPLWWEEVPDCDPADYTIDTVPARLAEHGDPWADLDSRTGSLDLLLELAEEQKEPDAPWPPHFAKTGDEPTRAQPSRRRAEAAPGYTSGASGRRKSTKPLIEVARAAGKEEALAGLERWKARHPDVWPHLREPDVLVDSMRGRSSTWTRIRLNLEHVPAELRPPQEELEVDFDPWAGVRDQDWPGRATDPPPPHLRNEG